MIWMAGRFCRGSCHKYVAHGVEVWPADERLSYAAVMQAPNKCHTSATSVTKTPQPTKTQTPRLSILAAFSATLTLNLSER